MPLQSAPTLPPNVSIFTPKSKSSPKPTSTASATHLLLHARRFTRLSASASTTPERLAQALRAAHPSVNDTFCLSHGRAVLIFDGASANRSEEQAEEPAGDADLDAKLDDTHHEHFRRVCLALRDADIGLDVAKCVHDAETALQAGFQLDAMSDGASVLVIDLMHAEDEDDEDSDEEVSESDEKVES